MLLRILNIQTLNTQKVNIQKFGIRIGCSNELNEIVVVFSIQITVTLAFFHLFGFLNENSFRTDQSKLQISWKNSQRKKTEA